MKKVMLALLLCSLNTPVSANSALVTAGSRLVMNLAQSGRQVPASVRLLATRCGACGGGVCSCQLSLRELGEMKDFISHRRPELESLAEESPAVAELLSQYNAREEQLAEIGRLLN